MTTKHKWLLDRLLLPAGIIPPTVNLEDFTVYEKSRQELGAKGYEYFYMMGQNFEDIKKTALANNIYALHSPWPTFGPVETLNEPLRTIVDFIVLRNRRLPKNAMTRTEDSLKFAKLVGAKVVTIHISFLDHTNLKDELAKLESLEKEYQIQIAIEHEPKITLEDPNNTILKINGSKKWVTNPQSLIETLDKIYPNHKFNLTIDSAALIGQGIPLVPTIKPIIKRIAHVHLANDETGEELATEINRPDIVDLVRLLYEGNYKGFITTEVHGAIGKKELSLTKWHTAFAVLGLNFLRSKVLQNAQTHYKNSCNYLLTNI